MKKLLSVVMAAFLVMSSCFAVHAERTTGESKKITSGETVYASPSSAGSLLVWDCYTISAAQSGKMSMTVKTDGDVVVKVLGSDGNIIAPYEYKAETSDSEVKKHDYGWWLNGEGSASYYVQEGDYTICFACTTSYSTCSAVMVVNAPKGIDVLVNGTQIAFDQQPIIVDGRTLVPVRAIFEALGASVDWYSETATVVSKRGNTSIKMTIGSNTMQKDGKDITLDVPAQIVNERTLVPVRAIAEAFGCNVDWNSDTQTVTITE
jgi:hypothetical protein